MTAIISYVFLGAGVFSLLYFGRICRYCGYAPDFSWFWSGVGAMLFLAVIFLQFVANADEKVGFVVSWLFFLTGSFLLCFFRLFFIILKKEGNKQASDSAEYVIVLGAKVNGCVPSKALYSRIRAAYEYLIKNKDTKAVLCGGQGRGEDICEARAMEKELLAMGIEKERLLIEDLSTTTIENIEMAAKLIPDKKADILVITSDFHTMRGKAIAKEVGFSKVQTLGAESSKVMRLHYYTRETLSWVLYGIRRNSKRRMDKGKK